MPFGKRSMDEKALLAAAQEIYRKFARIDDPAWALKRWAKLPQLTRDRWLDEARSCIQTYLDTEGSQR